MKGYKGFDNKMQGRNDFQYEVGKTYTMDDNIEVCKSGFHFCTELKNVFEYYKIYNKNVYCEIEEHGNILNDGKKSCTNNIHIKKLCDGVIEGVYFKEGKLHREDGPAIEYANGDKLCYKEGKRHREHGPAIENADGNKYWYKEGKRHREYGAAI